MAKTFLVHNGKEYSYEQLLHDLSQIKELSRYVYVAGNDPYQIFLSVIHSLINRYSIEMIDGDFSDNELDQLGLSKYVLTAVEKLEAPIEIVDFPNVLAHLADVQEWSISLFTSGTTGRPKKVAHRFQNLTRTAKVGDNFRNKVWAFAYNPTHIAGLQVFFQAFLNQNTIVYAFDGQQRALDQLIRKYQITNISATVTYYRSVLPYMNGTYESVERVTFGGEKYDLKTEELVRSIFPNAKIRNIYASTEAGSLFVAKSDLFEIEEWTRDLVQVNNNQELMIHRSLLGASESFTMEGDWYITGDIVEFVDDKHFRFVSRQSEMINVGGYKVNPNEVENCLMNVPGVIDLVVKAKENKITGNILTLQIVKEEGVDGMELKKAIKQYASEHLQQWKIPRIIEFGDKITRSRTGKKIRT
jgi:acyl-coenzyme A synthetase/AMP-(fatty) acid ligase